MIKSAKFYTSKGYSVIATGDTKRAILPWKKYQSEIAADRELKEMFEHPKCSGLAVICGAVSGNLEVIDVDLKYDTTGRLWEEFTEAIGDLFAKLYCVKTKSGGFHLYYKCEYIEGNQKLANRPATEAELKENPNVKEIVLIETRGEGGYVIAPPTPGYTKQKEFHVPILSVDERELLLSAARSFNQVVEEVRPDARTTQNATAYQKTPWDDYNDRADVVALLEKHGWKYVETKGPRVMLKRPGNTDQRSSGDYHKELNLFKVFSTSTQFELNKGYKPFAVYTVLEHGGDFKAAARQLSAEGYGETGAVSKIASKVKQGLGKGLPVDQISKILVSEDGLSEKDAQRIIDDVEQQNGPEILTFWSVAVVKGGTRITIIREKLLQFLYDSGFHLFFYNPHSSIYRMVRQYDGFVEDATTESIKKFVKDYIYNLPEKFDGITPAELMEVILKGSDTYFGKGVIEFLGRKEIDLLKDTPTEAYFTFTNGVVKVTEQGAEMLTYGQIGKSVWRSQVIDFKVDLDINFDESLCEFYDFMQKVSGEKIMYLISLIGYLLHRYKDPSRPYAVILAEETEDEKKGGGTGKGILVTALAHMANIERVDGKNFKLDKNFAFQRVGLDTKIVAIEDVRKNVDFEGFYSIITEGMTIEKKNKDEFTIPYKDSPKILFTTNYTVAGAGGHGKRRQKVFEFSDYFSVNKSPMDEYGHKLFDDWDADEWNRFYNLMFLCVMGYLQRGVVPVENSEKIRRKHIRLNYSPEFMDWWDGYMENGHTDWKAFREMYNGYLLANNFDKKDYSQKRFRSAIEEACDRFEYCLHSRRNGYERILEYKVEKRQS
jgi:hypothetical protein